MNEGRKEGEKEKGKEGEQGRKQEIKEGGKEGRRKERKG